MYESSRCIYTRWRKGGSGRSAVCVVKKEKKEMETVANNDDEKSVVWCGAVWCGVMWCDVT